MGHTQGLQLINTKAWLSKWYVDINYNNLIYNDYLIRKYLTNKFKNLNLFFSKIIIQQKKNKIFIYVNFSIIKKKNIESLINIDEIKKVLNKLTNKEIFFYYSLINNFDSQIIAQYIAKQLELRKKFKNIFNKIILKIQKIKNKKQYKGLRIQISGRPTGNEMANIQWNKYKEIPLHSLNIKIDYSFLTVLTKYGICGIKVWIAYN